MRSASRWLQPNRCIGPGPIARVVTAACSIALFRLGSATRCFTLRFLVELAPLQFGRTDVTESLALHVEGHVADAQRGMPSANAICASANGLFLTTCSWPWSVFILPVVVLSNGATCWERVDSPGPGCL